MNKKGITPIIAVVLLLMMTVAAAGAAFYWLNRMQQQAQSGVTGRQQQLMEEASASLTLLTQSFNPSTGILYVDIQNSGGTSISIDARDIVGILEDGDGNSLCAANDLNKTSSLYCNASSSATDSCNGNLFPNSVKRLRIDLGNCSTLLDGNTYFYQLKFRKGASVAGTIIG